MMRTELHTGDAEIAAASMKELFSSAVALRAGRDTPFRLDLTNRSAGGLTVLDFRLAGFDAFARIDADGLLAAGFVRIEGGQMTNGRDVIDLDQPWLYAETLESRWRVATTSVLQFDVERLQGYARRASGDDALTLRATGIGPVDSGAARRWHATMQHIRAVLDAGEAIAEQPLVLATSFDLAAALFLDTFQTTWLTRRAAREGSSRSRTLQRALAYIDEHAHEPISVLDIAEAARLTPRGLQALFQRELGVTPMERLRRVRLRGVHDALILADPTSTTVAEIAHRWGFAHLGRFAGQFAAEFGLRPSELLRH
jgi:AraC-like DNA-binding protein